jgi:hypothetical protein
VGGGGGGVFLQLILIRWPQAVRQMRGVGERGERRVGVGQITAHGNPYSSFSLSFFSLCVRQGFDEKILISAVQYTPPIRPPCGPQRFLRSPSAAPASSLFRHSLGGCSAGSDLSTSG